MEKGALYISPPASACLVHRRFSGIVISVSPIVLLEIAPRYEVAVCGDRQSVVRPWENGVGQPVVLEDVLQQIAGTKSTYGNQFERMVTRVPIVIQRVLGVGYTTRYSPAISIPLSWFTSRT